MKQLHDLVHLLLCDKQHESDMMEVMNRVDHKCYYYLENDIAGGDLMQDHVAWAAVVVKFKDTLDFPSDEAAMEFINKCIKVAQEIRSLSGNDINKMAFIRRLID